ncbi:MAG: SpoIID/LytB domain-containing protein [Acutalibacteraceae bacterium]
MKGYAILTAVVFAVLLLLPIAFGGAKDSSAPENTEVSESGTRQETTTAVQETAKQVSAAEEVFTVQHSDGQTESDISAYDLVLYATIGELPADTAPQALRAQAVACYTYFCYQKNSRAQDDSVSFDVAGTAQPFPQAFCEEYWREKWGESYDSVMAVYREAVDAVIGSRILYDGQPIMAAYHAINAGRTESAATVWEEDIPYLQSVASPADLLSPHIDSTVTLSAEEMKEKLCAAQAGLTLPEEYTAWFGEAKRSEAGTVLSLCIGDTTFSGQQVRQALSLRSADFEVSAADGEFTLTVHGYGHFVGLSQEGADALARDGYSWQDILHYYYSGVDIEESGKG